MFWVCLLLDAKGIKNGLYAEENINFFKSNNK